MALSDNKITTYVDNIKDLSNRPSADGVTAAALKTLFDGRTDKEVKQKHNALIDAQLNFWLDICQIALVEAIEVKNTTMVSYIIGPVDILAKMAIARDRHKPKFF